MDILATCVTVGLINFLGLILPGPDFILVTRNSVTSRAAGISTSLGVTCGLVFHLLVVFFFLGSIQKHFPNFLMYISYLGAAYLIYMAYKLFLSFWTSKDNIQSVVSMSTPKNKPAAKPNYKYFLVGLFTNLFNVKCYLFHVSILSQYFDPGMDPILIPILMAIILASCMLWFSSLSYLISMELFRSKFERFQTKFDGILALALTFFAIKIILN